MRIHWGLPASAALLLGACSEAADRNVAANAAAPVVAGNSNAAGTNRSVPTASAGDERRVRIGIDGEHGMDACHTQGRISGQDSVGVLAAPRDGARRVAETEPGLTVDICETIPGWYGVVYRGPGDPEDCGVGENLARPQDYAGRCRSGWVPENNVEVTAG
jgi:hypothetical protein